MANETTEYWVQQYFYAHEEKRKVVGKQMYEEAAKLRDLERQALDELGFVWNNYGKGKTKSFNIRTKDEFEYVIKTRREGKFKELFG